VLEHASLSNSSSTCSSTILTCGRYKTGQHSRVLCGVEMNYIRIGPKLLDCVKEMTDLADRIKKNIPRPQEGSKLIPIDFFIFFFLQRTVNAGKSIALLTENRLYQDALVIARTVLEGNYYLRAFLKDDSLGRKWNSYYVLEKYQEEYKSNSKAAADKLLANEFAPDLVAQAKNEFEDAFRDTKKRPKWYKYPTLYQLVQNLFDPNGFYKESYGTFYSIFSKVLHWTPLGVLDAEMYEGAALSIAYWGLLEISEAVNTEFNLGFDDDLDAMRSRFVAYVRRFN
jgi:Family of unknown function (DUF5677)